MLSINWTMVMVMLNFLILLYLMAAFLYKPMMKFLDERGEKIKKDLADAERNRLESEEMLHKREEQLKTTRQEARQIIDEAESRAKGVAERIIKEGEMMRANILSEAEEQKKVLIEKAKEDLTKELMELSAGLASKMIMASIDKYDQEKIVTEYLSKWDKNA